MRAASRLGVLGGTFDPIHVGHLTLAKEALACAELDRLLLIPASVPPHKAAASAPAADRLAMCRLASAELRGVDVSDLEIRRDGPSYTVETLSELASANPGAELHLVLGWGLASDDANASSALIPRKSSGFFARRNSSCSGKSLPGTLGAAIRSAAFELKFLAGFEDFRRRAAGNDGFQFAPIG